MAATWENVSVDMYAQQIFQSPYESKQYESKQSDQSLLAEWRNYTLGYPKCTQWSFWSDCTAWKRWLILVFAGRTVTRLLFLLFFHRKNNNGYFIEIVATFHFEKKIVDESTVSFITTQVDTLNILH